MTDALVVINQTHQSSFIIIKFKQTRHTQTDALLGASPSCRPPPNLSHSASGACLHTFFRIAAVRHVIRLARDSLPTSELQRAKTTEPTSACSAMCGANAWDERPIHSLLNPKLPSLQEPSMFNHSSSFCTTTW